MLKSPEGRSMPLRTRNIAILSLLTLSAGLVSERAERHESIGVRATMASEPVIAHLGGSMMEGCAVELDALKTCLKTEAEARAEQQAAEQARLEKLIEEQNLRDFYAKVTAEENARKAAEAKADAERRVKAADAAAAQAATKPATRYPVGCENYRSMVAQYPWPVESAMTTMSEESGCNPNAISDTNDYGLFQLHNQEVFDPAENIRIAFGKWKDGRVGEENFSAWYAVCTPGDNPQPKFAGIDCQ